MVVVLLLLVLSPQRHLLHFIGSPRCLPLRTVGLDGNPATGAGQACEVVRDTCARVADGAACEAWRRHAREAESRWRFAHPDNAERRQAEYERMARIVSESCGG